MHGTLQPPVRSRMGRLAVVHASADRALWLALVPLLLLLRPYGGLIQDARIYIGSAMAERDPAGLGRDLMFSADGQTGFTALKPVLRVLLGVLAPTEVSLALAFVGSLLWLGATVALCRSLAQGRAAWAAAVCILALPPDYGGFGLFGYGQTVVTPRMFAEAAVMAALAAWLGGRRPLAGLCLAAALALHPIMALPGVAVAAVLLAWEDRRWRLPIGGTIALVLGAAALRLPVVGRLVEPFDADWLAVIRGRSVNLFPSQWSADAYARMACQAAAVVLAATAAAPRSRRLLAAVLGVATGGLLLSALFGDRLPLILVTQLQPWRALWLLALVGNACFLIAALHLWHAGAAGRLTLALLVLAQVAASTAPPVAIGLASAAVALRALDLRGLVRTLSRRVAAVAVGLACGAAALQTVAGLISLVGYVRAGWAQGGTIVYDQLLMPGVQVWPLVLGSLGVAIEAGAGRRSAQAWPAWTTILPMAAVAGASAIALPVWNGGGSEQRMIDAPRRETEALRRLIGPEPGPVLWVDDYNQAWFLAERPSFFNSGQGAPILFSRDLALAWQRRGERLVGAGLVRQIDVTPWLGTDVRDGDLPVSRDMVETVCRDPDHPVAIVLPGTHRDIAPAGGQGGVWRPAEPVEYVAPMEAGLHWNRIGSYTVIRCPAADTTPPA